MPKLNTKPSTPKATAAQKLLDTVSSLLSNQKADVADNADPVNAPFSPLSLFNPTPQSVASVIAFLLDPQGLTQTINAFSERLLPGSDQPH